MASNPQTRKINPGDYRDAPAWFTGRFLNALNNFMDGIWNALNNALTFAQNFNAFYYSKTITAGATAGANAYQFAIPPSFQGRPIEVVKASCVVAGAPETNLGAAVDFSWYSAAGVVYVKEVFGLTAGTSYVLTLRIS